jgi:hypothetical protein
MLLIQRDKRGWKFEQSIKQISWPIINYDWSTDNSQHYTDNQTLTKKEERTCEVSFEVKTLFWQFDSNFQETIRKLEVSQNFFENTPFAISDLPVYPLRFAQEKIRAAIAERGNTFWKCRRRRYVEYSGHDYHMKEHEVSGCLWCAIMVSHSR